eukprot:1155546-Pelagomonas_calceolata.AAC.8
MKNPGGCWSRAPSHTQPTNQAQEHGATGKMLLSIGRILCSEGKHPSCLAVHHLQLECHGAEVTNSSTLVQPLPPWWAASNHPGQGTGRSL